MGTLYKTPALVHQPHRAAGSHPLGWAERGFFRIPLVRTVVCLPGLGASGRSFTPMALLAPHLRLQLWTPALRTPETHTPLQWNVESLAHPDTQLPGRFALVGSSFGSLVSLAFTLAHPERVRALVLAFNVFAGDFLLQHLS